MDCLNVLGAVVCYGSLPPGCLSNFLATLCRTVNIEPLCQTSWKIMRNLLGTHLGHSGLYTMCNFMEATERSDDVSVIRGAVFFVGVSLWGSKIIRSLKYSPNAVLSSFEKVIRYS
jgi:tuberous sclerosis protein 2